MFKLYIFRACFFGVKAKYAPTNNNNTLQNTSSAKDDEQHQQTLPSSGTAPAASRDGVARTEATSREARANVDTTLADVGRPEGDPVAERTPSASSRSSAAESATAPQAPTRTGGGLNACRFPDMSPEAVRMCDARQTLDGLKLEDHKLGQGSYGMVIRGTYQGIRCAIKIMLTAGLDSIAVRELLLAPCLRHPNIVATFTTRCATLTNSFFDLLEGRGELQRNPSLGNGQDSPRLLGPSNLWSGDGFGEPPADVRGGGPDSLPLFHDVLNVLKAEVGKVVVVVVQEYCDLRTLDNAIQIGAFREAERWGLRLARRTLLRCTVEIATAMLHLHESGVVHGDLKPTNLLLKTANRDRRGFIVKVADFGLCQVLPSAATSILTQTWGSVGYMAPESFDGKISRATDVWSFGVVLWQMLTGSRPYSNCHIDHVVAGVATGSLVLKWPEGAPMAGPIVDLGRRCLMHDPKQRPDFKAIIANLVDFEREIRQEPLAAAVRHAAAGSATGS